MPPRKSNPTTPASRGKAPRPPSTGKGASSHATSSKVTLDSLPPLDLPDSLTPDYVPPTSPFRHLTLDERDSLVHEMIGFHPRRMLDVIFDDASHTMYDLVRDMEADIRARAEALGEEYEREADIGLHALETLFESHMDKAFDKFYAWALRNPFDVPQELQIVLPWQRNLDLVRGAHVAELPGGPEAVLAKIDALRTDVERARFASQELEKAEKLLDRRLEIARQRKSEVGFVGEVLASSGLAPLPPKAALISSNLNTLHSTISPLEMPVPQVSQITAGTKAWELGRQAYLNWAVGKLVSEGGPAAGDDRMEGIENDLRGVAGAGKEGLEAAMRSI